MFSNHGSGYTATKLNAFTSFFSNILPTFWHDPIFREKNLTVCVCVCGFRPIPPFSFWMNSVWDKVRINGPPEELRKLVTKLVYCLVWAHGWSYLRQLGSHKHTTTKTTGRLTHRHHAGTCQGPDNTSPTARRWHAILKEDDIQNTHLQIRRQHLFVFVHVGLADQLWQRPVRLWRRLQLRGLVHHLVLAVHGPDVGRGLLGHDHAGLLGQERREGLGRKSAALVGLRQRWIFGRISRNRSGNVPGAATFRGGCPRMLITGFLGVCDVSGTLQRRRLSVRWAGAHFLIKEGMIPETDFAPLRTGHRLAELTVV